MARPRKQIDEQLIERLARIGCTVEEIAVAAGCSKDTLERRFAAPIEKGREGGKTSLRRMQWKSARGGNVGMQIWLGKQLLGQRDKKDVTTGDQPLKGYVGISPDDWDADQDSEGKPSGDV